MLFKPGPGSYKVQKKKNKKAKYIKIRKDFYESQPITKQQLDLENPLGLKNHDNNSETYYSTESHSKKQKRNFLY